MDKNKTSKWVNSVALVVLIIGGLNFLLMGLFNFDLFGAIFGGSDAVVTRIIYTLFGLAALTLLAVVCWHAFMEPQMKSSRKVEQTATVAVAPVKKTPTQQRKTTPKTSV